MLSQIGSHNNIAAILPCYQNTGDETTIITMDGQSLISHLRIRTIIQQLARHLMTDLVALKKYTSRTTAHILLQPLPLDPELTLVPIKVRKPRLAGDTSTGYINLHAVSSISKNHAAQTIIHLSCGSLVPALWTVATVQKHMHYARLASTYAPHYQRQRSPTGLLPKEGDGTIPDLTPIAQKLVEVMYEILILKTKPPHKYT